MLNEKFTFCFKITIKWNLTKSHAARLKLATYKTRFIKLLETNDSLLIKHPNIKENHLDRCDLHINHDGTRVLAKNLRLCPQKYWHDKDYLKEILTRLNTVKKYSKLITNDLNHESKFVHLVEEEYDLALKFSQINSETPKNNL